MSDEAEVIPIERAREKRAKEGQAARSAYAQLAAEIDASMKAAMDGMPRWWEGPLLVDEHGRPLVWR